MSWSEVVSLKDGKVVAVCLTMEAAEAAQRLMGDDYWCIHHYMEW